MKTRHTRICGIQWKWWSIQTIHFPMILLKIWNNSIPEVAVLFPFSWAIWRIFFFRSSLSSSRLSIYKIKIVSIFLYFNQENNQLTTALASFKRIWFSALYCCCFKLLLFLNSVKSIIVFGSRPKIKSRMIKTLLIFKWTTKTSYGNWLSSSNWL